MSSFRSFAIVPAAGRSCRMGRPKLLLPWGETTVIQRVLAAWTASHVTRVAVVVRPDDQRLASLCRQVDVDVVVPPAAPAEMKVSIEHGLRHIERHYRPEPTDVWLLAPADMPQLAASTVNYLLAHHQIGRPVILVPTSGGRRGHPVLFPWPLGQAVFQLPADQGVNALVSRHPVEEIMISDRNVLDDLDTPDDYRRLRDGEPPG